MKYYIKTKNNIITLLGSAKKVPSKPEYAEITEEQYTNYMAILDNIEEKSGYTKKVTLYVDGSYDVEYLPIVELEDEE